MDNFDLRKYVANKTLTTTPKRRVPVQEAKKKKLSYMEDLAEIDKQSAITAMEAKINKLAEMIETKTQRISLVSEDENLSELIDKKRVKEMQREIKEIERAKLKLEKLFEKMNGGAKKEIVDEEKEDDVDEALGTINDPDTPTSHGNVAEEGGYGGLGSEYDTGYDNEKGEVIDDEDLDERYNSKYEEDEMYENLKPHTLREYRKKRFLKEDLLGQIKQIKDYNKTEDTLNYKDYFITKDIIDGKDMYSVFPKEGDGDSSDIPDFESSNPEAIKKFLQDK